MNRIVECAANFSEGRQQEVIDAITRAMLTVPEVYLLDVQMDADHNRSVITLAGSPERIGQSAVLGVEAAIPLIDLTRHQGEHPRIGAADVIPFIPVAGVTLEDCVAIAKSVAEEIALRFQIPVYLYEAAATRPERIQLEKIRKGQFEVLRHDIENNPDRRPDFGAARIHPTAGASVVGARKPLVAFNINLDTPDVAIAKEIARTIRFSSGGLPCVKAIGLLLQKRNQAQVSMNLTDFEQTSMDVIFETVRREADRHGVRIASSEIVGLIPQKALNQAASAYLKVENFKQSMILEHRLAEAITQSASFMSRSVGDFVDHVASAEPAPGGGSVAALAGALGVALGLMAIEITKSKKNYVQHAATYEDSLRRLSSYRARLSRLMDSDAEAYGHVIQAYKIPKGTAGREQAIQESLIGATEVPAQTADAALEASQLLKEMESLIHPNVASDLEVGRLMLRTAIQGGIANVRINLQNINNEEVRRRFESRIEAIQAASD